MRNSLGVKFGLSYIAIIAVLLLLMNTYPNSSHRKCF